MIDFYIDFSNDIEKDIDIYYDDLCGVLKIYFNKKIFDNSNETNAMDIIKNNVSNEDVLDAVDQEISDLKKYMSIDNEFVDYNNMKLALLNSLKQLVSCDKVENILNNYHLLTKNPEEFVQFFRKYPDLKPKKILYCNTIDLNRKNIANALELQKEIPNIEFQVYGNEKPKRPEEMKDAYKVIDNMVREVEQFDYSPLEKALHAYDLVRNREYKKDKYDKIHPENSRDLVSVLNSDSIVCAGFANIYIKVLNELGIKVDQYVLSPNDDSDYGHARVVAYIKDDKYKKEGIYIFDPTWDCKTKDNSFLDSYKYFAKTLSNSERLTPKYDDTFKRFTLKAYDDNFANRSTDLTGAGVSDYDTWSFVNTLYYLSNFVFDEDENIEDYKINQYMKEQTIKEDDLKDLINYFESLRTDEITCFEFLNMLVTVRNNEHKCNKNIPLVKEEDYYKLLSNSYFIYQPTKDILPLVRIFEDIGDELTKRKVLVDNEVKRYSFMKESIGKKLVKTLNNYKEQK